MRLSELRGKELLRSCGLATPECRGAMTPAEAAAATRELGGMAVVKAMVPVGGRGKAGLVRRVYSPEEAEAAAVEILGRTHGGQVVRHLLVEQLLDVAHEYYLAVILDPSRGGPILLFSSEGGVDIEEVAQRTPERLIRAQVDPSTGEVDRELTARMAWMEHIPINLMDQIEEIARSLARIYAAQDMVLAEINPLVLTADGQVLAADCKLEVDDSALFRHPEVRLEAESALLPIEREVKELGGTLISLDGGDVAIICNGAGMGMAILDMLKRVGLKAANFLDTGGGLRKERARGIFAAVLRERGYRAALVNLWGGMAYLDEIAEALIEVIAETRPPYPVVVKLIGNNQARAMDLLEQSGIAVARVVETEKAVAMMARTLAPAGGN